MKHKELSEKVSVMYSGARQDGHLLIEKLRRPVGEGSVPLQFIQATRHVKERLENLYDEKNMIDEQWQRRQKYLKQSLTFQMFQKQSHKVWVYWELVIIFFRFLAGSTKLGMAICLTMLPLAKMLNLLIFFWETMMTLSQKLKYE